MIQVYRRNWLRLKDKYDNKARIIFQSEFRKLALTIPFDSMEEDNYQVFTEFYINREGIFDAYLKVYSEIGGIHGMRVGKEINKQIKKKDFTVDAFLAEFQRRLSLWLIQNGGQRITSVRSNYISYVNEIIAKGIEDGKTIRQIASGMTKVINNRNFYRWQALRIARTETTTASNYAATVSSKVSGVLMDKVWISSQDSRTRRTPKSKFDHATMNQVRVALEEPFNVNGELIMYAGAPFTPQGTPTSAQNIINCRCSIAQVVRRDSNGNIMRT